VPVSIFTISKRAPEYHRIHMTVMCAITFSLMKL